MTEDADARGRTPVGIVLVSLLVGLYGGVWLLTSILAGTVGNDAIATFSVAVAASVLTLAYYLSRGSRTAWWVTLALLAASTAWRLSLVGNGHPENLSNAAVGGVLVTYLLAKHEFYRPTGPQGG